MSQLEIVGFNGAPLGRVGLKEPVTRDDYLPFNFFKVGTLEESRISEAIFDRYEQEGRLTRLPQSAIVEYPEETPVHELALSVGFVKADFLRVLNETRTELGETQFSYRWREISQAEGVLHSDRQVPSRRTLRLLRPKPKIWYWIEDLTEAKDMLIDWNEGFCSRFDKKWVDEQNEIQAVRDDPEKIKQKLAPFEEIAMCAAASGIDQGRLLQSHIRWFSCFFERDSSEELTKKRFEAGIRLVLRGVTWATFKPLVEEYRTKVTRGK